MTNGEFLRFVRSGYSNPKYWSTEGWGWKTFRNVKWPTFWVVDGPQGLHRCVVEPMMMHKWDPRVLKNTTHVLHDLFVLLP